MDSAVTAAGNSAAEQALPPEAAWIASPGLPMALNGPEAHPWRRFGSDDPERPILERLHEVARAIPDHLAVDDGVTRIRYGQLWRTVLCLGQAIVKARPPGSRAPVAILLPDDSFYAAALFAGLVAGCPIVPLDRHVPTARINDILRDSHADLAILRAADLAAQALPAEVRPVLLETALLDMPGDAPPDYAALAADIPAVILYTSGSTGQPKGVAIGQAGWAQHMRLRSAAARWGVGDRVLRLGPMGTAWGVNTNGGVLVSGATTQIVDLPRVGLGAVLRLIAEREVTVLNAGPTLVKALLRLPGSASALATLRVVGLGGEPVLRADVEEIRAGLPRHCFLNNSIASTETYIGQCYLTEARDYDASRAPSGFVSPDYEVAFIAEDGRPSARGEAGEICVRSRYVALGDWRDGKLDRTRFPSDPRDPAKRVFRTGDLARMAEDGMIVVLGRRDRMLKINGQRVEPAEIEAAARRHAEVLDCIVLPWQDGRHPRLVAFTVPRAAAAAEGLAERLQHVLRQELPAYLVPHRIEVRPELPLLPGGKIDARALLASLAETPPSAPTAEPTASMGSRALVDRAWRQTLGANAPLDRSFADAGGDSLQMLQLVFRLEKALGTELPLEAFLMESSVEDLARIADRHSPAGTAAAASAARVPGQVPVFLLPGMAFADPNLAGFCARLPRDIPIAVLNWPDWRDLCREGYGASNLLADLARRVHDRAPSGPILLLGYSIGGYVAHALARVLRDAGRDVAFLGLLDSTSSPRELVPAISTRLIRDIAKDVGLADRGRPRRHLSVGTRLARFLARLLTGPRGIVLLRWARDKRGLPLSGAWGAMLAHRMRRDMLLRVVRVATVAGDFVAPLPDVPTVLFRASEDPANKQPDLGWGAYCPVLRIVPVRGDHMTMLAGAEDADLADRLVVELRRAHAFG